ncbi:MAG: hypothetical protein IJ007_08240 [Oscillospiraceae bacterium]|nr:hypothetical protein [Oscillospiraceae bacterium]
MKFFFTDLKRIFTEPAFYISIGLNLILLFGAFAFLIINSSTDRLFISAQSLALPFAAPVLAAMPYSVMIMQEKETRFSTLITIKLRKGGYHFTRLLTCGISGAAALFIPQLILWTVCFFMQSPYDLSYVLKYPLLALSFGFGYAAISYGLTFVNSQRYVPLVMPQVIYLLCIYAFPHLKLDKYYPPLDISPAIYGGEITADRLIIPIMLTAAAFILTLIGKAADSR